MIRIILKTRARKEEKIKIAGCSPSAETIVFASAAGQVSARIKSDLKRPTVDYKNRWFIQAFGIFQNSKSLLISSMVAQPHGQFKIFAQDIENPLGPLLSIHSQPPGYRSSDPNCLRSQGDGFKNIGTAADSAVNQHLHIPRMWYRYIISPQRSLRTQRINPELFNLPLWSLRALR